MDTPLEIPVLIGRKRDGGELTGAEISALVRAHTDGGMGDEQMAALLMAGVIRGFTRDEAIALTEAFVASGETIDLSGFRGPTVDKHSTGGVGDTTTLVVGPILAATGAQVAKLSGRGLGHTGGTLDKLEAIPGFTVDLSAGRLRDQVRDIGLAVAAATQDLVPADKRIYALRDVTATVPSPALIAASVMSKKIAGGAGHIVLDVKCGNGAFMTDRDQALALARLCTDIGTAHGRRTGALVTDMSQPLGDAIGNGLEVAAAVDVLRGEGGRRLGELSRRLAAAALELTGRSAEQARADVDAVLDQGDALESFRRFVAAQGGDPLVADTPRKILPSAPVVRDWTPSGEGYVHGFATRRLGELAALLGAGRQRRGDQVDPAVGIEVLVRVGDRVAADRPAARVHARTDDAAQRVAEELGEVVRVAPEPAEPVELVAGSVGVASA